MCTVTIIPKGGDDFVLTSNRDEAPDRIPLTPDFYSINNVKMLFPKDEKGGGTWIGLSEKNRLICLLNGGFICHVKESTYRVSRGVVVKDLLATDDIVLAIEEYDLDNVEPFTLVIADWNNKLRFFELVWDGAQKYFNKLPIEPKIWSSSTLYSNEMKQDRLSWFNAYKENNDLNAESILEFHKTAGLENKEYGVIMDRGDVKTTSVTQVEKTDGIVKMDYLSLKNNTTTSKSFKTLVTVNE
ncbi:hypothetical protein D7030_11910 [Flavobacteriaceae bacterium AU392]|nr:hypothetical protein D1817_12760 [Flavobacteriaceae bacterium]RKM82856.1 hypothetical protein D7030_11910 [Flavobacteriaceae bacterium AU392]